MRTAYQDEYLNNLYACRNALEDKINTLPGNHQYMEFPGWVDLDDKITKIIDPEGYTRRMTCRTCTLASAMRKCKQGCKFECGEPQMVIPSLDKMTPSEQQKWFLDVEEIEIV